MENTISATELHFVCVIIFSTQIEASNREGPKCVVVLFQQFLENRYKRTVVSGVGVVKVEEQTTFSQRRC